MIVAKTVKIKKQTQNLLELDNPVCIHYRRTRLLSIELKWIIWKLKWKLKIESELFNLSNINKDFCLQTDFGLVPAYIRLLMVKGLEDILLQKSGTSSQLTLGNLIAFQNLLRKYILLLIYWMPITCLCNLCRTFVGQWKDLTRIYMHFSLLLFSQSYHINFVIGIYYIIVIEAVFLNGVNSPQICDA